MRLKEMQRRRLRKKSPEALKQKYKKIVALSEELIALEKKKQGCTNPKEKKDLEKKRWRLLRKMQILKFRISALEEALKQRK